MTHLLLEVLTLKIYKILYVLLRLKVKKNHQNILLLRDKN